MRRAAAEGAQKFDFLRGGEPYKYAWGARDRQLLSVTLTGSSAMPTSSPDWLRGYPQSLRDTLGRGARALFPRSSHPAFSGAA